MKSIIFFLLFILIGIVHPKNESNKESFAVSFSGGASINGPITHFFYRETKDKLINPGFCGSVGIEYGAFEVLDITQLFFSLSAGYTKVSTSEFQLENFPSTAKLIIETFPVLFWTKLQVDTKLSPFIEIGLGISKLNFIERYSDGLNGASFNYWAFGYAFGAGLNYKISQKYDLSIAAHSLTNEKSKMMENDRGHLSGINIRNTVLAFSIKLNIKLQ